MQIKFILEAEKDYKFLDGNIKKLVNEKDKMEIYKEVGKRISKRK